MGLTTLPLYHPCWLSDPVRHGWDLSSLDRDDEWVVGRWSVYRSLAVASSREPDDGVQKRKIPKFVRVLVAPKPTLPSRTTLSIHDDLNGIKGPIESGCYARGVKCGSSEPSSMCSQRSASVLPGFTRQGRGFDTPRIDQLPL
jgi:hypothetical protein